jgi:bifunctional ADP-heptose synthase (sugar kinase/adenylyltransferase)
VPVVALNRKEYRIGGASQCCIKYCISLGAQYRNHFHHWAMMKTVTKLLQLMEQTRNHITSNIIRKSLTDRITTNKMRIISRNQQMMRLDAEMVPMILIHLYEAQLLQSVRSIIIDQQ